MKVSCKNCGYTVFGKMRDLKDIINYCPVCHKKMWKLDHKEPGKIKKFFKKVFFS
jgi:Zn finger protein HypA/HybF involved in hydrogenase expression